MGINIKHSQALHASLMMSFVRLANASTFSTLKRHFMSLEIFAICSWSISPIPADKALCENMFSGDSLTVISPIFLRQLLLLCQ